ncbi:MAG: MerR family transcriptional regulator [bacterium]|nr:MerR family transcriptional regulator [bacterium]
MYSVKEFCNIVGVPFSTLRYYERIELLNPKKNKVNNYRIYTKEDIKTVNMFRYYRSLGIETAEAVRIMNANNALELVRNSLVSRENKIIQELFQLNRQLKAMEQMEENLKLKDTGEIQICEGQGIYFISLIEEEEYISNNYEKIAKWSELLPITMHGRLLSYKQLMGKRIYLEDYKFGLAIRERDMCLLDAWCLEGAVCLEEQKVLMTYLELAEDNLLENEQMKKALQYIEENNYKIAGDLFLEALPVCSENQKQGEIIRIPIKNRE